MDRKAYGKRLSNAAMGWLAQQSMEAYSLWMAWLFQPDPELQSLILENTPDHCRELVRKAYQRDK